MLISGALNKSLNVPHWSLKSTCFRVDLFVERISKDLSRKNSQLNNQRWPITVDCLRYLPTWEAIAIQRSSKNNSTQEKVDSSNDWWWMLHLMGSCICGFYTRPHSHGFFNIEEMAEKPWEPARSAYSLVFMLQKDKWNLHFISSKRYRSKDLIFTRKRETGNGKRTVVISIRREFKTAKAWPRCADAGPVLILISAS